MLQQLPFRLEPVKGECTTSYLWRLCAKLDLDPLRLRDLFDDRFEFDFRLNIGLTRPQAEAFQQVCGLTKVQVKNLTLDGLAARSVAWQPPRKNGQLARPVSGTSAYGHRYRGGPWSKFCPKCLEEDDAWRLEWMIEWVHVCPTHGSLLLSNCSCGAPGKPFGVPRKGTSVGKPYLQGSFLECATPNDGTRCEVRLSDLESDRIEFHAVYSALSKVRELALTTPSGDYAESFQMLRHLARTCRIIYPSSLHSKKMLHNKVVADIDPYLDERDLRNPHLLWGSREDSVYSGQSLATLELISTISAGMAMAHFDNDEYISLLKPFVLRARAEKMGCSNEARRLQPAPPMRSSPSGPDNLAEAA